MFPADQRAFGVVSYVSSLMCVFFQIFCLFELLLQQQLTDLFLSTYRNLLCPPKKHQSAPDS